MSTELKYIKIIFFKIYKLVKLILFTPLILFVIFISFFKKIRFSSIDYFVGGSVINGKNYFLRKKNGLLPKYLDFFFIDQAYKIFLLKKDISNIFWMELLARKFMFIDPKNKILFLIYNFLLQNIYDTLVFLKIKKLILVMFYTNGDFKLNQNDVKLNQQNDTYIKLSKEDFFKCDNEYNKLSKIINKKPEQSLIVLYNRDGAYKKYQNPNFDMSYHDWRNFPVSDFELTIKNLSKKNRFLIRLGNITEQKLDLSDKNFFDYSKSDYITPYLDIYLLYKCKFFLGSEGGLDKIGMGLNKPMALVNVHHLDWRCPLGRDTIFIPQKMFNLETNKFLTIAELLDPNLKKSKISDLPVGLYTRTSDYKEAGIKVINNTPEEINNLAQEMDFHLDKKLELSNDDLKLQNEFWSKFRNSFPFNKKYIISPSFLKNNQDLLA